MKDIQINVEGKNTIKVLETSTGVLIVLKESETIKPKAKEKYYYVVFNAIKGFFVWTTTWDDSEMDESLYLSGNCFNEELEPESIACEFNFRFKSRII